MFIHAIYLFILTGWIPSCLLFSLWFVWWLWHLSLLVSLPITASQFSDTYYCQSVLWHLLLPVKVCSGRGRWVDTNIPYLVSWQLQCPKKVSFRPETGPEFPQNDKNPKLFGTNLFLMEFSILFLVLTCINREKIFCLFRGGNLLFVSTVFHIDNLRSVADPCPIFILSPFFNLDLFLLKILLPCCWCPLSDLSLSTP